MTPQQEVQQERLLEISKLGKNWDGYQSPPVDPRAIAATIPAIEVIQACVGTEPWIVPTANGGIQIEWHRHGIDVEIEIGSDGRLVDCEIWQDDEEDDDAMTMSLAEMIDHDLAVNASQPDPEPAAVLEACHAALDRLVGHIDELRTRIETLEARNGQDS